MHYLDHAATTWPRPVEIGEAMVRTLADTGNAGRSGHALSLRAARALFAARHRAAGFLGVSDPRRVLFTAGCTAALNVVLRGLLRPGSHVVTTGLEHNAVARPLRALEEERGIRISRIPGDTTGRISSAALAAACTPETALVVVNHASNVSGTLQDLAALRAATDRPFLVDAAQTAGHLPVDVDGLGLDYVAMPGHKGLCGPPGVGILCLGARAALPEPLVRGGTGSRSEEDRHPDFLPDRLEAGTPNVPGIAGLDAALAWLERERAPLAQRLLALGTEFLEGVLRMDGVRLVGPPTVSGRVPVFSLLIEGIDPGMAARRLEQDSAVLVRSGLHCAPWAHETLGTFPGGTVRFSFGPTSPAESAAVALEALGRLVRGR
jgi:cysteine desulfurase/selenocysteine lyase